MHGWTNCASDQAAISGSALADEFNFAVVYPAGTKYVISVKRSGFNAGYSMFYFSGVDDVSFLRYVIADVSAELNIDAARIYATGWSRACAETDRRRSASVAAGRRSASSPPRRHDAGSRRSNGCMMAQRMALEASELTTARVTARRPTTGRVAFEKTTPRRASTSVTSRTRVVYRERADEPRTLAPLELLHRAASTHGVDVTATRRQKKRESLTRIIRRRGQLGRRSIGGRLRRGDLLRRMRGRPRKPRSSRSMTRAI